MFATIGLKQRIREAKNKNEITSLLVEGNDYEFVSRHTKRQWTRVANSKLKEFKQEKTDVKKKSNS